MGEHEGREDQCGPSPTGALPEGAAKPERSTADPAQCLGLPPFRAKYSRPDDLGPDSLDMLAALDEPELLMHALRKLANARPGKSWAIIDQHVGYAITSLKVANEPAPRA
jgi:hypothetical protein